MALLTPGRHRGTEILDDPRVDPAARARSMSDVVRSNGVLGGRRAALGEFSASLEGLGRNGTLLDVGTGLGDIPAGAVFRSNRAGITLTTVGIDAAESLVRRTVDEGRVTHGVCGNALALPFASGSVDVVLCSQVLHHFEEAAAVQLITEMHRVARHRVIISDLRRSWVAAAGFWLACFPLGFDPITRHDGVTSVLRGFTKPELHALVRRATGASPFIRQWAGYRLTASWAPRRSGIAA